MNERRRTRILSIRNWPIAWKLVLAMLGILLAAQVFITMVGETLVRDSLIQGEERELFERAYQQARLVRAFRDERMAQLYATAWQNSETLLKGDPAACRAVLEDELSRIGKFYDLSLLDGNGRVLASTEPALEGQDLSAESWFPGVQRRQAGISHLREFADKSALGFVFHVPVPDVNAEGGYSPRALAGRLPAALLWELVDVVRVRESGYAYMADENAILIAHGAWDRATNRVTHALILRPIGAENDPPVMAASAQNLYGRQVITGWLNIPTLAAFIQQGVPSPSSASVDPMPNIHHYAFGVQKTTAAVPVGALQGLTIPHEIEETDWVLGVTVNDADFLAPLDRLRQGLLTVTVIGVLLAFVAALLYSRTITRPLSRLAQLASRVEQGAYDERLYLQQEDELGQLAGGLNTMLDRLAAALAAQQRQMETLLHTADVVGQDAETVSTSAEELAAATEELSASADEVALTVQEMARDASEQMNQVQHTAGAVRALDGEIGQIAGLSQQVMQSSTHMRTLAEETERGVAAAREHSRRIETVVRMIEKFSRQTNMLALNATIEAARAGEMGESFTVVAKEVRRLADGSQQALVEISALNQAVRKSMEAIDGAMGQTKAAIVDVVTLAEQMTQAAGRQAEASHAIVDVVNRLAAIAERNAAASEEMAASVEEQTSAFAEIGQASQEMAGLALHLQALVRRLTRGESEEEDKEVSQNGT